MIEQNRMYRMNKKLKTTLVLAPWYVCIINCMSYEFSKQINKLGFKYVCLTFY